MKIKRFTYFIFSIIIFAPNINFAFGQSGDSLLTRLHGLTYGSDEYFNIDGCEISFRKIPVTFSKGNIIKNFRKLKIKEAELSETDTTIQLKNYVYSKTEKAFDEINTHLYCYFVATRNNEFAAVLFASLWELDKNFILEIVNLLIYDGVPGDNYSPISGDSINFGGRYIRMGAYCKWMNINNIQCSGFGQMNWSVCKNREIADRALQYQKRSVEQDNKGGKVLSQDTVNVIFEGVETQAIKIVWDVKGFASALIRMSSGAKTLTIYFVSAPVRGNYIFSVMSFWDTDNITDGGLAPLINEVMQLKR